MLVTAELLLRLTPEEREELRATLRREDLSPRVRERLEMVKAADLGHDLGQITAWSGRTPRTVRRWVGAFASGGIGGPPPPPPPSPSAPRSGRPVGAGAAYLRALEEAVETPPRRLGLGFEVWTSERLCSYLSRTSEIEISSGWLRALLARRRFACGRAKHTLKHLRDPQEVVACEAELEEAQKN